MQFRKSASEAVYIGIDPTGRRGFLRCPVTEMTAEEVRAWYEIDPVTAGKYVWPESIAKIPVNYIKVDNNPGQPPPKLKHATNNGK